MPQPQFPKIKCPPSLLEEFGQNLAPDSIIREPEQLRNYASDKTEDLVYLPDIVLKPKDVAQVSMILKRANEEGIPVYTRSRGTGLAGSSLATRGGICLSMEAFDQILEVDTENLMMVTQPYVLNYQIQLAAQKVGLFYPPDPSSYRICSIGGNIAMNSSGPKAVKYGGTRNYVLGLEAVLVDGTVINTGSRTLKNSSGYSLTQLLVGSEGSLGVVTKAILRLIPLPKHDSLVLVTFASLEAACKAVHGILVRGIVPCGLELMERKALQYAKDYNQVSFPPLSDGVAAHLLIELDGNNSEELEFERKIIIEMMQEQYEAVEIFRADDEGEKKALWNLRRSVYMGIKAHDVVKEMDFCVPIARLPDMIREMEAIGEDSGFQCASYGHAGDGNLHVGIIAPSDAPRVEEGIRRVFAYACSIGGVISGEHGIGLVQKPYLPLLYEEKQLDLMRSIKSAFDPNGILNPDKIF